MRSRWGWIGQSLIRRSVNSSHTGRFYRLGVERLEDRNLLNAGPLSIMGDAALSLIPALTNTVGSDVRLSDGPALPTEAVDRGLHLGLSVGPSIASGNASS